MDNVGLNTIKRFEFTEILGWSVSRFDKFQLCKRQYYFDYYGKYDPEVPRSKIVALKAMTSVPLEVGNVVHDSVKTLLERLLKSEQPVDQAKFLDYASRKAADYCAAKSFAEVYYGELPAVDSAAVAENARRCLGNFLASERFEWIVRKAVTNKSGWVIEPPGFGETRIGGLKAYCKVDFLFPVDGSLHILDWKTGKQDEKKHRRQLIGYATWASYHFAADPSSIYPRAVYLTPEYREMQVTVNEFDLQEFVSGVEADTRSMYAFCSNVERNLPKPRDEFPKTPHTAACRFCNYRELCR